MFVLHANWFLDRLDLWAQRADRRPDRIESPNAPPPVPGSAPDPFAARLRETHGPAHGSLNLLDHAELRRLAGDIWDSLLISVAADAMLTLKLPSRLGRWLTAQTAIDPQLRAGTEVELKPCPIPAMRFKAADALDLLCGNAHFGPWSVIPAASFRYWSRVASLVLELLCSQQYVSTIHHVHSDQYEGLWRLLVEDDQTKRRLDQLIASMPPVCRAMAHPESPEPLQAVEILESFLRTTGDAFVRRVLEGDDLAHALRGKPEPSWRPERLWLRSLVSSDSRLAGEPGQREFIAATVREWVGKLAPPSLESPFRVCFRLEESPGAFSSTSEEGGEWQLSIHLQSRHDPSWVIPAEQIVHCRPSKPAILPRPFGIAPDEWRDRIREAATLFPPLAKLAQAGGPTSCTLNVHEAYSLLRDAAPVLERGGFGVRLPHWWRERRHGLRMQLRLRPLGEKVSTSLDNSSLSLDALVAYDWQVALGDETIASEELDALASAKAPLVRIRGHWTEVQAGDLAKALAFMRRQVDEPITVADALHQYFAADDHETGLPVVDLRAQGWIERLLNAAQAADRIERLQQPRGFQGRLRAYQLAGLKWLRFLSRHGLGGCLADDMGLGKTIQLIALLLSEREDEREGTVGPTLLVVPMSLVGNWQREIARFAPSLCAMVHHGMERLTGKAFAGAVASTDVVISTYGLVHRDCKHLAAVAWHRIALDEAQNIKNPAAKQSAAIRLLRARHHVALTGTPVENRLSELWSIMDFLNPGHLGTAHDFRRRYAIPIERSHESGAAHRLRQMIRPFVLRRLKSDPAVAADLPAKLEMKIYCNLTTEQAALYKALVDELFGRIDGVIGMKRRGVILASLVRLKQVCDHPALFLSDHSALAHRSGKCDRLVEMLEEVIAEGDKALIFTQFRKMGELLQKFLMDSLDREVLFLHGGTPRKQRDALIETFQRGTEDAPLFVLSLKAGGFGLNLTEASHVFHFDRWWNPAVEDQATDRVHRIGQRRRVQVHKYICIGTLEERIDALIEQKRELAKNIVGAGERWLTEFSTDDLRKLVTLSGEAVSED